MKRNMDLVRQISLTISNYKYGYAPTDIKICPFTDEEIGYHCLLMGEAGLLLTEDTSALGESSPSAIPIRITWAGHEFIDNARNETIWNQTKEVVSKIGDVSFSVWASVLSKIVMHSLKIDS